MSYILEIKDLQVDLLTEYGIGHGTRGIDLCLQRGEIHGIVGESGCGKTVTAKSVLRLHDEKKTQYHGEILYQGKNLLEANQKELRKIRGGEISYVFQQPMTSFDNLFPIGNQIVETILAHENCSKKEAWERTYKLLEAVGVTPAKKRAKQYPYEFSGGMLQRTMIAMSIAANPSVLIADEVTTALDVTMQARVLELLKTLRDRQNLSILCITHNFGVVAEICDTVSVMYAGTVVETGPVRKIFHESVHPYTKKLIAHLKNDYQITGEVPQISTVPYEITQEFSGCAYAGQCPYKDSLCQSKAPEVVQVGEAHTCQCHYALQEKKEVKITA